MKQLLALLLFVPSLCFAQSVTLPYNPDANADSAIGPRRICSRLLPLFGGYLHPGGGPDRRDGPSTST